ncbi:Asp23/Gls24 family envelope stress response protein [Rathayibacter sp. SD072]|uniref:Asp23/Gls24 family envelope stress response protein n=1 Tax=Rathayibacter sp. SD072 TaxID=2781731 RepID=UPI001A96521F|nr:Asp23/Gls24 family envelope stress response protein [Rathayibacter sp. SD072]MBO0985164.1 Asp23/Gls24 family envelope stress response protein [Rathayibacter sp. SD072]
MTDDPRLDDSRLDPAVPLDDARPIDLGAIDTAHPDPETPRDLLATTVAETALGTTGVHHLGGPAARGLDRAARAVLGTSTIPGVTISEDEGRTVIDLDLVVEYPHTVNEVMEEARTQVLRAASQVHASPVAVNITVTDVHGPFDPIEPEPVAEGDSLVEKAGDVADEAGARLSEAGDRITGAAGAAVEKAAGALDAVGERAADALDAAADEADRRTEERERSVADAADAVPDAEGPRSDHDDAPQVVEVQADGTTPVVVVVVEQPTEERAGSTEPIDSAGSTDATGSTDERAHSVAPAAEKTGE